ncbi:hypothetical protein GSY74_04370, partial [Sulfurovum sp. bin170]|uniref:hypothetical protein n=1 Tax=Sulfurovum sp. bin170 TaxID=2695268 RepID=UPI001418E3F6
MFLKTVRWVLVLLILFIFVACGSSSSGDYFITQTGTLNDSKVTGVSYRCGSNSGLTTADGEFSCRSDSDNIEFTIGSVILGSIKTTELKDFTIYPADLVGVDRSDTNSSEVVNILQILQSLDSDKNPNNGIVITEAIRETLGKIDTIRLDINSTTQADLNATLAEVGRELIKVDYAVAHYEDTLRYEIGSKIDTVPPAPAITTQKSTNKNLTPITIYGERGAKIFVDGSDSTINIDNNHTAIINLDTTGDDGYMSFIITLQDNLNKMGDELNLTILKDTVPPSKPTASTYPEYVNYNSVNVTILGEENATLLLDDRSVGTIHNGELSIDLNTSGSDGAKNFDIVLMDLAGNRSEPLVITITRDTVAPDKPTIVTSSALVNGELPATIMGEADAKVYIDGVSYGTIDSDGKLNTNIPNPSLSYYETLYIKQVDLAGNESPTLSFTTTFSRIALSSTVTYYIPQNMTLIRGGSFDGEGIIMAYQSDEVVAGSVIKVTLNGNETLKEWLNRMVSNINGLLNINSMTQITQQQIAENLGRTGVITEYSLQTRTNIGTVDLISLMLNSIIGGTLSNLPSSSSSAITSNYFNVIFSLVKESSGETYLTISIVP